MSSIKLNAIHFPVFPLNRNKPTQLDGVTLYIRKYMKDDKEVQDYQIVDDTNVPGTSLALRRLQLKSMGIRLKPITKALYFLGDLIKLAKAGMWFIDSTGKVFQYTKTRTVRLEFRKINKVVPIPTGGALLEVQGIPNRLKCLYNPRLEDRYAGVLVDGMSYILYGLYEQKYDNTTRRI